MNKLVKFCITFVRQVGIVPPTKQILLVPLTLPVANHDNFVGTHFQTVGWYSTVS